MTSQVGDFQRTVWNTRWVKCLILTAIELWLNLLSKIRYMPVYWNWKINANQHAKNYLHCEVFRFVTDFYCCLYINNVQIFVKCTQNTIVYCLILPRKFLLKWHRFYTHMCAHASLIIMLIIYPKYIKTILVIHAPNMVQIKQGNGHYRPCVLYIKLFT